MTDELKACPFCGGPGGNIHKDHDRNCYFFVKETIDGQMYGCVDEWNTRPIEDALRAEIERLKWVLDNIEKMYPALDEYGGNGCWVKIGFLHRLQDIARAALEKREAAND